MQELDKISRDLWSNSSKSNPPTLDQFMPQKKTKGNKKSRLKGTNNADTRNRAQLPPVMNFTPMPSQKISGSEAEFLSRQLQEHSGSQAPLESVIWDNIAPLSAIKSRSAGNGDQEVSSRDPFAKEKTQLVRQLESQQQTIQSKENEINAKDEKIKQLTSEVDRLRRSLSSELAKLKSEVIISLVCFFLFQSSAHVLFSTIWRFCD